ncbi:MAG: phosphate-starvation-inducible PsiE family protein [Desulfurococcales archaeon]|nr:phosphate-starvation-inducible PsiE family protein [Desulfurococcales archaeon]
MSRIDKAFQIAIELLEAVLAFVLILLVAISSIKLILMVYNTVHSEVVEKESILQILDIALLLILSIDILRTLLTAITTRRFPLRIVVEAAMIAVLREIISIEIRHLDYKMIIALTIALVGLGFIRTLLLASERRRG